MAIKFQEAVEQKPPAQKFDKTAYQRDYMRRRRTVGRVYFLSGPNPDDPIKIGFTKGDPKRRVAVLQIGCPFRLVLLGSIPGTIKSESDLHRVYAGQRLSGEWFRRTPELIAEFAAGGLTITQAHTSPALSGGAGPVLKM